MFVGDTHGSKEHLCYIMQTAIDRDVLAVIQVGDFGYFPEQPWGKEFLDYVDALIYELGVPLFFVRGNHDDVDSLNRIPVNSEGVRVVRAGLFNIPDGGVIELDGYTILGVGGAWSIDWRSLTPGETWWPNEKVTEPQIELATKMALAHQPDIIVTHDCPSVVPQRLLLRETARSYPEADEQRMLLGRLHRAYQPELWLHGHYHRNYRFEGGPTQFVGLSREYTARNSWYIVD